MEREIVVIATSNTHKLDEIKEILSDFQFDIKSMSEVGLGGLEIIEDGSTFEENAMIKAKTVMNKTGYASIADDSGLEVDAINKAPGIYSARFAGENATDAQNNEKLLNLIANVPEDLRTGRFICAIAMVFPNGESIITRGTCEGSIGFEPTGNGGFGYDPLFIVPEYNKTFGEIPAEIKNKISHRANALNELKSSLKVYLERI
ncbi:XTP/dITP diphosphatase [Serpentinicella alkaliphila]|uniref:dITP/XTP pyrophosphatase n=1 Tax=Serpentinicella alkaliphila TaxID=1734049 RepID=A0A4R2TLX3_9FIRM|nr:XTP/dITP diphosphatase [Serpentinicella alkaliphila]QUH24816.1 XTP/dITP diphosphatase [Serpentinicella alkaliphila]TCQ03482.1 XTP/dITP diphosphohydrolase [Serpentinicella alkaliphila]